MTYTEEERLTAQALVSNKGFTDLIRKVFTEREDKLNSDVVIALDNQRLGELMRADFMAEEKLKMRYTQLVQLGTKLEGKSNKVKS